MASELFEVLINEMYFQGFSIMNQLRHLYFIDVINPFAITSIDTNLFNKAYFVFPSYVEHNDKSEIFNQIREICNSESEGTFNMDLRQVMTKIFLTIECKKHINQYKLI